MKKILILMVLSVFSIPAFAACSITGGACTASILNNTTLQEKYAPNHLEQIQKPDAFTPRYVTPYQDMLINTDTPSNTVGSETKDYNSNCQFGVCLPGVTPSEGTIFD